MITDFVKKWTGVKETGSNAGFANKAFEIMLKNVGWKSGESWCMYLAKALQLDAHPKDAVNINKILNGSSQLSYNNAKADKTGTYKVVTAPAPGDIVIWYHTNNPGTGHAGTVVSVAGTSMKTFEGNTSDANISNGDTAAIKTRSCVIGATMGSLKLRGFIRKL